MRRIAIVTGTRADFGHLRWLTADLMAAEDVDVQLIVTGMHLSGAHGDTVSEIPFPIASKVPMLLHGDSAACIATSTAIGMMGMTQALSTLQPDCVVVLGDRFEIFAASAAAMLLHIPIAHIHGGETTEGAVDEQIRHAITKMAHLHFVAAEPYRQRVLQMGEAADRVHLVGAPGLDVIDRTVLPGRAELEAKLSWPMHGPLAVATYHPVTLDEDPAAGIHALLAALRALPELRVLFTGVNADEGNAAISAAIGAAVAAEPARFHAVQSLGQLGYLGAVRVADLVLGNSSSGLVEAPAVRTPTVNIGDRQRGRLRGGSVIDVSANAEAITAGIRAALVAVDSGDPPPYGGPGASRRIADILRAVDIGGLRRKVFADA